MTEEQSRRLMMQVRELDGYVPSGEQSVKLSYSAEEGDAGVAMTATRDGFLRLGTELLKAATISPCTAQEDGSYLIETDLSTLLHPGSDYTVNELTLVDAITEETPSEGETSQASDFLWGIFGIGCLTFLIIALLVGISTILCWLAKLIFGAW